MRKTDIIGLLLLAFIVGCRMDVSLADFYALKCYPVISAGLSRLASIIMVSLEEITVIVFAIAFIIVLISAISKKKGFLRWLMNTARVAMWLVVWLYMGWGNNYFRTPLYPRMGIEKVSYEEETFARFLSDYTEALNSSAKGTAGWKREELEADVKEYYSTVVTGYGYTELREWQHIKNPVLNPLYSAVGVLGFMGPFFCESQLNLELSDLEYPFTLSHELAHLAGVTSEAEANYWAFTFCRQSEDPSVRYSGYLGLLPYVAASARNLLPDERYAEWSSALAGKVKEDYSAIRQFWDGKRVKVIERVQRWMMDRFLKTNGVSEGAKDYAGVVGMIITMDAKSSVSESL